MDNITSQTNSDIHIHGNSEISSGDCFTEGDFSSQEWGDIETSSPSMRTDSFVERGTNDTASPRTVLVNELCEKNQMLECGWRASEARYIAMQKENDRLAALLSTEKMRASKYQKKLQYIQENHDVFDRLKQAYLSVKYNESTARPLIEIKETSCQTKDDQDYLEKHIQVHVEESNLTYSSCIDSSSSEEDATLTIYQKDLNAVKDTVKSLKALMLARETDNEIFANREAKFQKDIAILFKENLNLKRQSADKQKELDEALKQLSKKSLPKEANTLRKIIAKLEKRLRKVEPNYEKCRGDSVTNISEREKKIIDHIFNKYETKMKQRTQQLIAKSKSLRVIKKISTPYFTPRTPSDSRGFMSDPETPRTFRSCEDDGTIDRLEMESRKIILKMTKYTKNVQNHDKLKKSASEV